MHSLTAAGVAAPSEPEIERRTIRKVMWRLMPLMALLYVINNLDRVNVSFAALTMNRDLGLTPYVYGWGAGIFYVTYCLLEVPSNVFMARIGARVWIARIMITWGLVSGAMALVIGPWSFLTMRLLLGAAEAGFIPGMILYITYWFPAAYRGRAVALFLLASPISSAIASLLSVPILGMEGVAGLHGWQWMFLIEALPALILGGLVLVFLTNRPRDARWLTADERQWLERRIQQDQPADASHSVSLGRTLVDPRVLALSVVYLGRTASMYGITFFLPQIVKGIGLSNQAVGYVSALPYVVATIGMVLVASHSDRQNERRWHVIGTMMAAAAGLVAAGMLGNSAWALAALSIAAIGFFAMSPCFWPLPSMFLRGEAKAGGIAIINAIGNLGGFIGPYGVGLAAASTGSFASGLYFLAGCATLSGVVILAIGRPHHPAVARVGQREASHA